MVRDFDQPPLVGVLNRQNSTEVRSEAPRDSRSMRIIYAILMLLARILLTSGEKPLKRVETHIERLRLYFASAAAGNE